MNSKSQVIKYIVTDLLTASAAWTVFYVYRKLYLEPLKFGVEVELQFTERYYVGLLIIPLFWLSLYALTGFYNQVLRKSRLKEFIQSLWQSLLGVLIIFFALILDDQIADYRSYYSAFLVLFGVHFSTTFFFRFVITSQLVHKIHNREFGFNTLMVGSNEKALELFQELESQKKSSGFKFNGFVHINGGQDHRLNGHLKHLGHFRDVHEIIEEGEVEEVIIACETSEHDKLRSIIEKLEGEQVRIKVIPDTYDLLTGSVKMNSIFGTALIEVNHQIMPDSQLAIKRIMDVVISILALFLLTPVYLLTAILVKTGSKGPIFYSHERVGKNAKAFRMYKFRSMIQDAEKAGPQLSSERDPRITRFGRFMRKTRIDEIPQFWNVLIGDMSLVGPRPERQHYIDQITTRAPHYRYLHKVRPGITSWGQVKYGYAENVDEMIERLKYDVLYIENMSLLVDIKILIYTILIVLQGRGK